MTQSIELTQFYNEWYHWAKGGGVLDYCLSFRNYDGLCTCLYRWAIYKAGGSRSHAGDFAERLHEEMKNQFQAAGLSRVFPFGVDAFYDDEDTHTMHLRSERVNWVRDRLRSEF